MLRFVCFSSERFYIFVRKGLVDASRLSVRWVRQLWWTQNTVHSKTIFFALFPPSNVSSFQNVQEVVFSLSHHYSLRSWEIAHVKRFLPHHPPASGMSLLLNSYICVCSWASDPYPFLMNPIRLVLGTKNLCQGINKAIQNKN